MTSTGKPTGKKQDDKDDPISARTAARVAAVQALYQMDLAASDLNDVIAEFLEPWFTEEGREETIEGADRTFFADILRAVLRRQREIDPMVDEQLATGWRLVRVDSILRAVLRAGAAESTTTTCQRASSSMSISTLRGSFSRKTSHASSTVCSIKSPMRCGPRNSRRGPRSLKWRCQINMDAFRDRQDQRRNRTYPGLFRTAGGSRRLRP